MKWSRFLLVGVTSLVASVLTFKSAYDHIEATAHSSKISPMVYVFALCGVALTGFAVKWSWPSVKWLAIPLVFAIEAVFVFALAVRYGLPFP